MKKSDVIESPDLIQGGPGAGGDKEKLKRLHTKLSADTRISGIPKDYAAFEEMMSTPKGRSEVYGNLNNNPFITGLAPDIETFTTNLGFETADQRKARMIPPPKEPSSKAGPERPNVQNPKILPNEYPRFKEKTKDITPITPPEFVKDRFIQERDKAQQKDPLLDRIDQARDWEADEEEGVSGTLDKVVKIDPIKDAGFTPDLIKSALADKPVPVDATAGVMAPDVKDVTGDRAHFMSKAMENYDEYMKYNNSGAWKFRQSYLTERDARITGNREKGVFDFDVLAEVDEARDVAFKIDAIKYNTSLFSDRVMGYFGHDQNKADSYFEAMEEVQALAGDFESKLQELGTELEQEDYDMMTALQEKIIQRTKQINELYNVGFDEINDIDASLKAMHVLSQELIPLAEKTWTWAQEAEDWQKIVDANYEKARVVQHALPVRAPGSVNPLFETTGAGSLDPTLLYENTVRPVFNAVENFARGMLTLSRTLAANNEYGWTDKVGDLVDVTNNAFKGPSILNGKLFEDDGSVALEKVPSKVFDLAAQIAIFGGAGKAGQVVKAVGSRGGVAVAAFTMAHSDAYNEAVQSGLSREKASEYATMIATVSAVVETVIVDKIPWERAIGRSKLKKSMLDIILDGSDVTEAGTLAVGEYLLGLHAEGTEELIENLATTSAKYLINKAEGYDVYEDNLDGGEMAEAYLMGFGSKLFSFNNYISTKSDFELEALYTAAYNIDKTMAMLEKNNYSAEDINEIQLKLKEYREHLETIPEDTNVKYRVWLGALKADKARLMEEKAKAQAIIGKKYDGPTKYDEDIARIDKQIEEAVEESGMLALPPGPDTPKNPPPGQPEDVREGGVEPTPSPVTQPPVEPTPPSNLPSPRNQVEPPPTIGIDDEFREAATEILFSSDDEEEQSEMRTGFKGLPYHIQTGILVSVDKVLNEGGRKKLFDQFKEAVFVAGDFLISDEEDFDTWATTKQPDEELGEVSPSDIYSPEEISIAKFLSQAESDAEIADKFDQYNALVKGDPENGVKGLSKKAAIKELFNPKKNAKADIQSGPPNSGGNPKVRQKDEKEADQPDQGETKTEEGKSPSEGSEGEDGKRGVTPVGYSLTAIRKIDTDEARFQNRDSTSGEAQGLDEDRVKEIVENFDPQKMDPIVVWKDPSDNRYKVLSGHHRFEAMKRRGESNITTKEFFGTEKEAQDFAKDSNTLGKQETPTERAKRYRELRAEGKSESEIESMAKTAHGKDAPFIISLSRLDKKGKALENVTRFQDSPDQSSTSMFKSVAQWVGDLKKKFPDLTTAQENEVTDYAMQKWAPKKGKGKISTKNEFIDRVGYSIDKLKEKGLLKEDSVLNLNDKVGETSAEKEFNEALDEAKSNEETARKALDDKRKELIVGGASKADMDRVLKKYEDELQLAIKDLAEVRGLKDAFKQAGRDQTSIFDVIDSEPTIQEDETTQREIEAILDEKEAEGPEAQGADEGQEKRKQKFQVAPGEIKKNDPVIIKGDNGKDIDGKWIGTFDNGKKTLVATKDGQKEVPSSKVRKGSTTDVPVKPLAQGDGHTKGVFIGEDGKIYKSMESLKWDPNINWTDENAEIMKVPTGTGTREHELLSKNQDLPHLPKVGDVVQTTEGRAFEIEKLEPVEPGSLTFDEAKKVQSTIDELLKRGVSINDRHSVMRRPNGEIVLNDLSTADESDEPLAFDDLSYNVLDLMSPKDQDKFEKERAAKRDKWEKALFDKEGDAPVEAEGVKMPEAYKKAMDNYKQSDLGGSETKQELVEEAETSEGKEFVKDAVTKLPKNEDGTITVYRVGSMQEGHNPVTIHREMAEIFVRERDNRGLSSDIIEVRINPEDISVVVPGVEGELLVNVNRGNKSRIKSNTKSKQYTEKELKEKKSQVKDKLEKAKNARDKYLEDKKNGELPTGLNNLKTEKLVKDKVKNLEWQLSKLEETKPKIEPLTKEDAKKATVKEKPVKGSRRNKIKTALSKLADIGLLRSFKDPDKAMSTDEVDVAMALNDAMADVWKKTTGKDDFYETFIEGVQEGDLEGLRERTGLVLYQDESQSDIFRAPRLTLGVLDHPFFKQMEKSGRVPLNSVIDFMKKNGKKVEQKVINDALDNLMSSTGSRAVPYQQFHNAIEAELMPLRRLTQPVGSSHSNVGIRTTPGNYVKDKTHVFNMPIEHGEVGHFRSLYTNTIPEDWEAVAINPAEDMYAAVLRVRPPNLDEDNIANYVGETGSKEKVTAWIMGLKSGGELNKGLFGHVRTWNSGDSDDVVYVVENQSDPFQKTDVASEWEFKIRGAIRAEVDHQMDLKFGKDGNRHGELSDDEFSTIESQGFTDPYRYQQHKYIVKELNKLVDEGLISIDESVLQADGLPTIWRYTIDSINGQYGSTVYEYYEKNKEATGRAIPPNINNLSPGKFRPNEGVVGMNPETISRLREMNDALVTDDFLLTKEEREVKDQLTTQVAETINTEVNYEKYLSQLEELKKSFKMRNFREIMKLIAQDKAVNTVLVPSPLTLTFVEAWVDGKEYKAKKRSRSPQLPDYEILERETHPEGLRSGDVIRLDDGRIRTVIGTVPTDERVLTVPNDSVQELSQDEILDRVKNRMISLMYWDVSNYLFGKPDFTKDMPVDQETLADLLERIPATDEDWVQSALYHDGHLHREPPHSEHWRAGRGKLHSDLRGTYEDFLGQFTMPGRRVDQDGQGVNNWGQHVSLNFDEIFEINFNSSDFFSNQSASRVVRFLDVIDRPQLDYDTIIDVHGRDSFTRIQDRIIDYYAGPGGRMIFKFATPGNDILAVNQPDAESEEDKSVEAKGMVPQRVLDDLGNSQQGAVNAHSAFIRALKKERPDLEAFEDGNGVVWYKTQVSEDDRKKPVVAFQEEAGKIKGAVEFADDVRGLVHLFDGADISTLAHEFSGHIGLNFLRALGQHDPRYAADYNTLRAWAGVGVDDMWSTEAHEKVARGMERYLREGKAPTKELESIFKRIAQWLKSIYQSVVNGPLDIKLTDEVRAVFDRMFAGQPDRTDTNTTTPRDERQVNEAKGEFKKRHDPELPFLSISDNIDYPGSDQVQREEGEAESDSDTVKAKWNKLGHIPFTGTTRVKNAEDVAHIMRLLENKAVEHAFAVHVDANGDSHIQFISIGSTIGTVMDAKIILAGALKFGSKKVYLVHNHPSGNMKPSQSDTRLTDKLRDAFDMMDISLEHIIMDTYLNQFVYIDYEGDTSVRDRDPMLTDDTPLEVSFMDDQKVLSQPLGTIGSSKDVAEFIQQLKYTAMPKQAVLVLDMKNNIIGNYILKGGLDANKIMELVTDTGIGQSVIVYGNTAPVKEVNAIRKALGKFDIDLVDFIAVNSDNDSVKGYYRSYADEGILRETQSEYGTKPVGGSIQETAESYGPPRKSIFDMSDAELSKEVERRWGPSMGMGRPGESRSSSRFHDLVTFKKHMDDLYEKRDLQSMKEEYAKVDGKIKVQYIKAVKKEKNPHKENWVTHVHDSETPLVFPEDPPIPRQTQTQPPPVTNTTKPPPPPDKPKHPWEDYGPAKDDYGNIRFDIFNLVRLLKEFGKVPRVNPAMKKAFGRYVAKSSNDIGDVELMERLLYDTKLATEILAHEIGHFIDLAIELKGFGKEIHERIEPLKRLITTRFESDIIKNQAKSLSAKWRGPFEPGDKYRNSAAELFADYMSAIMVDPDMVQKEFPLLYDMFRELMAGKPEFRLAYETISKKIDGTEPIKEWRQDTDASSKSSLSIMDQALEKMPLKETLSNLYHGGVTMFISPFHNIRKKIPKDVRRRIGEGTALIDNLEYGRTFAAKDDTLWNNEYHKRVVKVLENVDPDPIRAAELLNQYAIAKRIMTETKASAEFIKQEPEMVRDMLTMLVMENQLDFLKHYGPSIASAPPEMMYDIFKSIVFDIHAAIKNSNKSNGENLKRRVEGLISKLFSEVGEDNVSGAKMMAAFNVRSNLLNPGGLTPDHAQGVHDQIRSEMTPAQYSALETASRNLSNLIFEVQEKMYMAGLISDSMYREVIEPNKDNYVPFAVMDYFEGRVGAGISNQYGTAKDIANTMLSSLLKVTAMHQWLAKQNQVQRVKDIADAYDIPYTISDQVMTSKDVAGVQKQEKEGNSHLTYYIDGKPYMLSIEDEFNSLSNAISPSGINDMDYMNMAEKVIRTAGGLYTTLSPSFIFFRNPLREMATKGQRLGYLSTMKHVFDPRVLLLARDYIKSAYTGELSDDVRELIENDILPPAQFSFWLTDNPDEVAEKMLAGMILQGMNYKKDDRSTITRYAGNVVDFLQESLATLEAAQKINAARIAAEYGATLPEQVAMSRRFGIPKPVVNSTSKEARVFMNTFFLFARVQMQGWRVERDFLADKTKNKGYAARWAVGELLTKLGLQMFGLFLAADWLKDWFDDDEEYERSMAARMGVWARKVSPYKLGIDRLVPLGFYDPRTGKFIEMTDSSIRASEIPEHWEAVSVRVPSSELGRSTGILTNGLFTAHDDAMRRADLNGYGEVLQAFVDQNMISANPYWEVAENLWDGYGGENNIDKFTGYYAFDPTMFEAGGKHKLDAMAAYVFKKGGGPGWMVGQIAATTGLVDPRAVENNRRGDDAITPLVEDLPVISSMLSFDNYIPTRERANMKGDQSETRAKAKLLLPVDVAEMYDYYYANLKDAQTKMWTFENDKEAKIKKWDEERIKLEKRKYWDEYKTKKFNTAKDWVNKYWGDGNAESALTALYGGAVYAVSEGASPMAADSMRQIITDVSQYHVHIFNNPEFYKDLMQIPRQPEVNNWKRTGIKKDIERRKAKMKAARSSE